MISSACWAHWGACPQRYFHHSGWNDDSILITKSDSESGSLAGTTVQDKVWTSSLHWHWQQRRTGSLHVTVLRTCRGPPFRSAPKSAAPQQPERRARRGLHQHRAATMALERRQFGPCPECPLRLLGGAHPRPRRSPRPPLQGRGCQWAPTTRTRRLRWTRSPDRARLGG